MPRRAGPYWTDARVALEILEPGAARPRLVLLGRPFALVGRIADAEIRFDDRGVSARHVYLHADRRGLFAVDLATRTGTRFGEVDAPCGWLRPGESIEVAGRVIRVEGFELGGRPVVPPPCAVDLLADAGTAPLVALTLEPVGQRGPSWAIGSELAFVGRNDGCAIRLNQASVSRTHCVLVRTSRAAYVVDLPGRPTLVNGQPPRGAAAIREGDVLTIGQVRFVARVVVGDDLDAAAESGAAPATPAGTHDLVRFGPTPAVPAAFGPSPAVPAGLNAADGLPFPIEQVPPEAREAVLGWMLGVLHSGQSEILRRQDELQHSVGLVLRHLQNDTTSRLEDQGGRIEALAADIRRLEARAAESQAAPAAGPPYPPPFPDEPPRPARDLPPAPEIDPTRSLATAAWLLDKIDKVSSDNKFTFRSLLAKLGPRRDDAPSGEHPGGDRPDPSTQSMSPSLDRDDGA